MMNWLECERLADGTEVKFRRVGREYQLVVVSPDPFEPPEVWYYASIATARQHLADVLRNDVFEVA